jgi:hypothetical protein
MFENIERIMLLWGIDDNVEIKEELKKLADANGVPFDVFPIQGSSILMIKCKDYKDKDRVFGPYRGEKEIQEFIKLLKKEESKKGGK